MAVPPKPNKYGMDHIRVVRNMEEKFIPPPTLFNRKMLFGAALVALVIAPFSLGAAVMFGAIGGLIGGWMQRNEMVTEYAAALRYRNDRMKAREKNKLGRSAQKAQALEAHGQELQHSAPDYDNSQVEKLDQQPSTDASRAR